MRIVSNGSKLNVPESWRRMTFTAETDYLVDTHQVKDHKAARAVLVQPPRVRLHDSIIRVRLPYADN